LSGESARMTRERWRTKLRRRPRRGAESLRSSHAVDSVGVERGVSPPPRRWGASLFLESFEWEKKSKCEHHPAARRRRYSPFDPHGVHGMTATMGFRASARPPPQPRTPMFARHCRRFTIQNRVPGRFEGQRFWRFARKGLFRYTPTGHWARAKLHPLTSGNRIFQEDPADAYIVTMPYA